MTRTPSSSPTRRGLLTGTGLAALTGAATLASAGRAAAAPRPAGGAAGPRGAKGAQLLSPVTSTIASPPLSGYTYRHVSMFDFTPESPNAQRAWGGRGVYTMGAESALWASVEIPAGALVRDIEWYVFNGSSTDVSALGRVWAAGSGTLFATLADTTIAPGTETVARRSVVPSTAYGPHPLGTRINLGCYTPTDGTVQINGARVGFSQGSATAGLLPAPVRAYDSRATGGKLTAGSTRTITLSGDLVPPGTTGVIANVTVASPEGAGHLIVYPGNAALPTASTLNYATGQVVANMVTVGVSSSRQIKVYSSKAAHVVVDVTGTVG